MIHSHHHHMHHYSTFVSSDGMTIAASSLPDEVLGKGFFILLFIGMILGSIFIRGFVADRHDHKLIQIADGTFAGMMFGVGAWCIFAIFAMMYFMVFGY